MADKRTSFRLALILVTVTTLSYAAQTSYKNIMSEKPLRTKPISLTPQKVAVLEKIRKLQNDPTETLTQIWIDSAGAWLNFVNEVVTFNQANNPTLYKLQVWTPQDTWLDTLTQTYTYNPDGLPIEMASKLWVASISAFDDYDKLTLTFDQQNLVGYYKQENFFYMGLDSLFPTSGLKDSSIITTAYNADGTVSQDSFQVVDLTTPPHNLVNDTRIRYAYNNLDTTLDQVLLEVWASGAWAPFRKVKILYNTRNTVAEEVYQEYTNGAWVNYMRYLYTYDANDSTTKDLLQAWNTTTSAWADYDQMLYEWDLNGNLTKVHYQVYWLTQSWDDQFRYTYTYNQNNQVTTMLYEISILGSWMNFLQGTASYNNNQLTEEIIKQWLANAWLNVERYAYTYGLAISSPFDIFSSNGKVANVTHRINGYNNATIHFTLAQPAKVSVNIFDLKGNCINSLGNNRKMNAGNKTIIWNTTSQSGTPVASGMYLYQLKVDDLTITNRMHLVK